MSLESTYIHLFSFERRLIRYALFALDNACAPHFPYGCCYTVAECNVLRTAYEIIWKKYDLGDHSKGIVAIKFVWITFTGTMARLAFRSKAWN